MSPRTRISRRAGPVSLDLQVPSWASRCGANGADHLSQRNGGTAMSPCGTVELPCPGRMRPTLDCPGPMGHSKHAASIEGGLEGWSGVNDISVVARDDALLAWKATGRLAEWLNERDSGSKPYREDGGRRSPMHKPTRFSVSFATRWAASTDKVKGKGCGTEAREPLGTASSTPLLERANDLGSWKVLIALYGSHICSHGTRKGVIGSKVAAFALSRISLFDGERGKRLRRYAEQSNLEGGVAKNILSKGAHNEQPPSSSRAKGNGRISHPDRQPGLPDSGTGGLPMWLNFCYLALIGCVAPTNTEKGPTDPGPAREKGYTWAPGPFSGRGARESV
ncbi:hypothetical protein MCOR27_006499 [Pyricularia oryzae]|nr:hypothetical protein MCOR01_007219 [Pyricularia oryzae]KAI6276437.1 hypothetical protein MCOR27_006499 [Pyricularia oryzae]KAI6286373.1 hypothetical protein MCOR26_001075 [Pyricularia oryzae]KAI6336361.1 hypothetical protein MCOR30_003640 [Pyricularia oryzae]KAI6368590.1 hypothetical protein MCOR32_006847 [Pyricularia oryzae]